MADDFFLVKQQETVSKLRPDQKSGPYMWALPVALSPSPSLFIHPRKNFQLLCQDWKIFPIALHSDSQPPLTHTSAFGCMRIGPDLKWNAAHFLCFGSKCSVSGWHEFSARCFSSPYFPLIYGLQPSSSLKFLHKKLDSSLRFHNSTGFHIYKSSNFYEGNDHGCLGSSENALNKLYAQHWGRWLKDLSTCLAC